MAVPLIAGAAELTGAAGAAAGAATVADGALVAVAEPLPFEAVTTTRMTEPTSPTPRR